MHSLRLAARLWTTRPGLTAAIVATLAVALGAVTAIFSIAYALLLRPLPFPQADRIVTIDAEVAGVTGRLALREYRELEREAKTLAHIGAYYRSQYNLTGDGPPIALTCTIPSATVFDVLGVRALQGAVWPSDLDFTRHYQVLLSHGLWQRRFGGTPDVVGQSIVMDGATYRVSGVLPPDVDFPLQTDVYRGVTDYNAPQVRRYSAIARLGEGRSLADLDGELRALSARFAAAWPETNRGVTLRALPLRDAYVGEARPFVLLMVGGVALLLVLASVNVANLLLTRALAQAGDVAVRLALGASRAHLVRQQLLEALLLAGGGTLLGAVGGVLAVRTVRDIVSRDLPPWMSLSIEPGVLIACALLAAVLAGAVSVLPLRQAFRTDMERVLRQQAGRSGRGGGQAARRWLVGAQAAVASLLLIAAGVFAGSLARLLTVDPGFDRRDTLTFRTDPPFTRYGDIASTSEFYRRAVEALQTIPGVTHAGTNTNLPFARLDVPSPRVTVEGRDAGRADEAPFVNLQLIDPGYFAAMRIPLRRGRAFERTDTADAPLVAVISDRTARRFWPDDDPIGRRFQLQWNQDGVGSGGGAALWLTVVGVVGAVQFAGVDDRTGLDVYAPNAQMFAGDSFFVVRASTPPASLGRQIRSAIDRVDRDQSFFDVVTLEDRVMRTLWQHRVATVVLTLFAGVALVLAVLGTYAVTAHAVAAQRREIGIRRALGSPASALARLVARQWMLPVAAGVVVGLAGGALAAPRLMAMLGTAADGPRWPFALPGALAGAALLACLLPLVRLLRHTPLNQALRAD